MKHITFLFLLCTLLFSCDPCKDVDCGANGQCDEDSGDCICDSWYAGSACELEIREKFLGTWNSTTNCTFNDEEVEPIWTVEAGTNIDEIIFKTETLYNNTLFRATLTDENNAVLEPITSGSAELTGTLTFINSSRLTFDLLDTRPNSETTCVFDLVN